MFGHDAWYITVTPNGQAISDVGAVSDELTSWTLIEKIYKGMKADFKALYGEPAACKETFMNGTPATPQEKLKQTSKGKCQYMSLFKVKAGLALLVISSYGGSIPKGVVVTDIIPASSPKYSEALENIKSMGY